MQKQNYFDINMNSNQLAKFTNNSRVFHLIRSEIHPVKFLQGDRIVGKRVALQLDETNFSHNVLSSISYWSLFHNF